ncbi:LytR C-terminal domain-containing protein [Arthrobacter antioxidans]|uniref:LytR C-terminal domain-containing protein n=1 Tax=Arthrobacter antioxidans TaxID=2895818 RepID=UPI0020001750|nr:LytR C-terminal domain-containing protein [Arthrobacter antioxidans]
MTDHPRDEFDRVPAASARQGVHRERLIPARSNGLAPKLAVGVLALLIGLGSFFLLPRLGFPGGNDGGTSSSSSPEASATGGGAATAEPSGTASPGATSEPDGTATGGASASASDEADPADRAQTVNVLNGTGAPGLASVAAGRLAGAGWTSALPGNWAGVPVDASVVFYNGEDQRADAEAVAEDLGITDLVESADVSPAISVVLGPEFQ